MSKYDERELFSGLAADHWAAISDTDPRLDQAYYRDLIASQGGRALELACGAGRLLLAYLREGFDMVGTDISGDITWSRAAYWRSTCSPATTTTHGRNCRNTRSRGRSRRRRISARAVG